MLALMPALCTCGADERFRDVKQNVCSEPKLTDAMPCFKVNFNGEAANTKKVPP
ncbi:hypothetical protein EDD52_1262 [Primorskyibacter sedentarius]|uniref:Uncharacterized protein n=1 Tax=Primorskyibacter sedentarius TaxID=745311 RepID=A0A4R3IYK9_9RHOB|nr:hypothetical protein EDD52_1262 [Primorskyibacter sedentarius]